MKHGRKHGRLGKSRPLIKKFVKKPALLAYAVLAVIITSFTGSRFTDVSGWYESVKPAITPPGFVFGIVWTILFALIAASIYLSLLNAQEKQKKPLMYLFGANLVLNILWSAFFFGMHNPVLSLIDLTLLWVSIMVLIYFTWKASKLSAWLLLPYALWVTFAGLLNYLIAFGWK